MCMLLSLGPRPSTYVRVLICGGGNNAVRPGLTDHVTGGHGVDMVTKNMRNMRRNASVTDRR